MGKTRKRTANKFDDDDGDFQDYTDRKRFDKSSNIQNKRRLKRQSEMERFEDEHE